MIEIIPAIDIIGGRCVRLRQGNYNDCRTYSASPRDMAARYADCGVRRIHVVDLDGAKASEPCNLRSLESIATTVSGIDIEWGGGIKSGEALRDVFDCGATAAVVGSVAVREPQLLHEWFAAWGGERVVLGADVRDGAVAVSGWTEVSNKSIESLADEFLPDGLQRMVCTDISRDGMLRGVDVSFYRELQRRYPSVTVTVSGGIGTMSDIAALDAAGLHSVIVGKAIYEGRITLKELERWLQNA